MAPPTGSQMRTVELGVTLTDAAVDENQTTIFCDRWHVDRAVQIAGVRAVTATLFPGR